MSAVTSPYGPGKMLFNCQTLEDLFRIKYAVSIGRLVSALTFVFYKTIEMLEFFPHSIHIQKTSGAYSKELLERRRSSKCLLDMHAAWVSNMIIIVQGLQKLTNISDSSME